MSEQAEEFKRFFRYTELSADVARVRAKLALGYGDGIEGKIIAYLQAVHLYEQSREAMSYSVIEGPKIELADALLRALDFPTAPSRRQEIPHRETKENQRRPIPSELRWKIWERDNYTCLHCGTRRDLTIDHKIAVVNGGTDDEDNLQTLCGSCNSREGAR